MNGVNTALILIVMLTITAVEGDGSVVFWGKSVTVKCPEGYTNLKKEGTTSTHVNVSLEDTTWGTLMTIEKQINGQYSCSLSDTDIYAFYIKGKVCENCYELDVTLAGVVIVADLLLTVGVMLTVYACVKRRSGEAATSKPAKPTSRSGDRAPPVPATDYEPLNNATRNRDIYSDVHRTG